MFKYVAVLATLVALAPPVSASNLPDYPFAHVSGVAMTYVPPDIGEVDFEIMVIDANPETAQALMDARVAAIREVMQVNSIAEGDFQVRNVRREMSKDQAVYSLKSTVRINVRDLTKWETVVKPLLNMPNLDGFMTEFTVSDREKVAAELMITAIQDARFKAKNIAAGAGRKLGDITAVSPGQLKNITTAMGLAPSVESYSRAPSRREQSNKDYLMIEAQRFSQPVDVIFRLK